MRRIIMHGAAICVYCPSIFSCQRSSGRKSRKSAFEAMRFRIRSNRSLTTSDFCRLLVGLGRLELPTSPLSGVRSNHLSYRPVAFQPLVELVGIEPAAS